MLCVRYVLPLLMVLALPVSAAAQTYPEVVEGSDLQIELRHLGPDDPLELPAPEPELEPEPRDVDAPRFAGTEVQWVWVLLALGILGAVLFLLARNSVSFGGGIEEGGAKAPPPTDPITGTEIDPALLGMKRNDFIDRLAAMADRREALRLLLARLLTDETARHGIRPARSWTGREVLRALPRSLPSMADLRHVLRQVELAWFGGREVGEAEFADCLDRGRRLLGDAA